MEFSLSGNALKIFARSVTCLARVGNELVLEASRSQLTCHTLNSSRSAYQLLTLKPDFFDVYSVSDVRVHYSVLLKAICSVLRTPIAGIDRLSMLLPDPNAPKVKWTLDCFNGMRKSYWITCNVEPDIQQLSLDRKQLPSSFIVKPRDLHRLLANFQSTLQEITIIATQPPVLAADASDPTGGKAVELRSYLDPTKENDSLLHTQLWIDPKEEFMQYTHTRDPVDVTFGVKELKAFHSFCEGCDIDIQLYFDKAGKPILMAPKFNSDDGSSISNFDSTLVLATMLVSQLNAENSVSVPPESSGGMPMHQYSNKNSSDHPCENTRIWSELSGSFAKDGTGAENNQVNGEGSQPVNERRTIQRIGQMHISSNNNYTEMPDCHANSSAMEMDNGGKPQDEAGVYDYTPFQRHPSNWVDAPEDDNEEDEAGFCIVSTPPYM